MIQNNPNFKSIFASQSNTKQLKDSHPFLHYQNRNNYLSILSDKYSKEMKLEGVDLRKNARIDYYLDRYEKVKSQREKEDKKNSCYLNSDQFKTVFVDCIEERRAYKRDKKQQERLRQNLNKIYLAQQITHEQPQHDIQQQTQKSKIPYETVLIDYQHNPRKQKQLYLLDLQIGKLKIQQQLDKKIKNDKIMCHNYQLISKLSNQILSSYMVHFDQIYNQLIDEILTEEVYYLNYIEAQYKIERSQWNQKRIPQSKMMYENAKTIQMMDLVKKLDQLCDQ